MLRSTETASMDRNSDRLPIYELERDFVAGLARHNRIIVQSPTGSGKSTQIPQMLLGAGYSGQIVVQQPRRIAARMLARRVALEQDTSVGKTVGYEVRFEKVTSAATRIRYVTEGVLLRQILRDRQLPGIDVVIFDEFHERHLFTDVTLALCLQLQRHRRSDLIVIVMSATLPEDRLQEFLHPCLLLQSRGREYPVACEYSASAGNGKQEPVWKRAANHCNQLIRQKREGDILVFMPGAYEIRQTLKALENFGSMKSVDCLPLHGDLPLEVQEKALLPQPGRKIVVATNVAETSLTINGIRIVIDSGLAKVAAYDPRRGINTLLTQKISQASADQRAGRAGRTAPGQCLRLWGAHDHENRPVFEIPEIRRLDLAEMVLSLKAAGIDDLERFPWFEPPHPASLEKSHQLLADLRAVDCESRNLTALGRRMVVFPIHPRYSRMLVTASDLGCLPDIALIAALSQGRPLVLPIREPRRARRRDEQLMDSSLPLSDFFYYTRAWAWAQENRFDPEFCREWGIHRHQALQALRLAKQFIHMAKTNGLNVRSQSRDPDLLRRCLLSAFSDNLAKRLDRATLRCQMTHNRRATLRRHSVARNAPLFVSADVEERQAGREITVLLGLNTEVEESWLQELFPSDFHEEASTEYDPRERRVLTRMSRRFRDLVLEQRELSDPEPGVAAGLLAREVAIGNLSLKFWDQTVESWINRVNFLACHCPEFKIAAIAEDERILILEQICYGASRYNEIRGRPVWPTLRAWLSPENRSALDRFAPERYLCPSGNRIAIRYQSAERAVLAATIQQLYGMTKHPTLAKGRFPLLVEILAPNRRAVQITQSLPAFWHESYPAIRKQLQGRYPKHEWR